MLMFLATVLEQLDFACEQIGKRDAHNSRFGLMLTDNAVELVSHQIAKDKSNELKHRGWLQETYKHQSSLEKALGKDFKEKVRFARIEGFIDQETAQSINILHALRNEVYHAGLQREEVLPALAAFYFDLACKFSATYKPHGVGWGSNQKLPERAKKYFCRDEFMPGDMDDFRKACGQLAEDCTHAPEETIEALADHLDIIIEQQDTCLDIVSQGVYESQRTTRDEAVLGMQAWKYAFSSDGKRELAEIKFKGNMLDWINWVQENKTFTIRKDPISAWEKQAEKLRRNTNPHAALTHYDSFVSETSELRELMEEAAQHVEAEIDLEIDRYRGN